MLFHYQVKKILKNKTANVLTCNSKQEGKKELSLKYLQNNFMGGACFRLDNEFNIFGTILMMVTRYHSHLQILDLTQTAQLFTQ